MLVAAFILGFVGSLHCAAMCGPLVLAVPVVGSLKSQIFVSRVVYNFGRITWYAILGIFFGMLGKSFVLAGFQQWLSIVTGVAMLTFLLLNRQRINAHAWRSSAWIKSTFRSFLHRRTYIAAFAMGAANGLLPCGLVYLAGTAAAASGEIGSSALYMFVFGLGTVPMLLGLGLFGRPLMKLLQQFGLKRLVPVAVTLIALSLILRGLALGIPYVSPEATNGNIRCADCGR